METIEAKQSMRTRRDDEDSDRFALLAIVALTVALALSGCGERKQQQSRTTVRITTWNLQWFPNGSPREATPAKQAENIARAADMLRTLNPDIALLQEVKGYDACHQLAEAIAPGEYHVAICARFKGGNQQTAILAKHHAWAAWYEEWKSLDGVDPPRGSAFAWFRIGKADIGVYSVHLKSNLVMGGDTAAETAKNIRKREVASQQILNHITTVIGPTMPTIESIVIGGDFNTNGDQPMFATETTLHTLANAGFVNVLGALPLAERITHPANHGFPGATFDYLFGRNASFGRPVITKTNASDHYPVTCDFAVR